VVKYFVFLVDTIYISVLKEFPSSNALPTFV